VNPSTGIASASTAGKSGNYVKLMRVEAITSGYYISCDSIFNASLDDSYAEYFSKVMPTANDVRFGMQFKTGTQVIYGDTDYITLRPGEYSTTCESEEVTDRVMYSPMYVITSQSAVPDATGISGHLFMVGTNSSTFNARMVGSAIGYSVGHGPLTLHNFTAALNLTYSVDGFRLLFNSGHIASGSAAVFVVKK
jgi:hypothetical protein